MLGKRVTFSIALAAFLLSLSAARSNAAEPVTVAQLKIIVSTHLLRKPGYQPGDLLCRSDVEPIFNELVDRGLKPYVGEEELFDAFLPDQDFLVQTFRTVAGLNFIRQVNKLPGAYDRLERLSWLKEGRTLLQQLSQSGDGPEVFKNLLTPEGTKLIEQGLSTDARMRNWRLPTGHIHTEAQLLDRLDKLVINRAANVKAAR